VPDDAASPTVHRPILIVGANGTGTTLLRLMLDSHERIAIPQETGILRLAAIHRWVPYWDLGGEWASNLDLSDDELVARLGDFYGGLLASYAAGRGKQRWGDKTPFHVWHLDLAARMFPELQVIAMVRHPGAVVMSLRRRFRRPTKRAVHHWKRSTKQVLQQAALLGDRCVVLRYEDLVRAPEETMRPLLEWLGEPWSDRVLSHHKVQPAGREAEGFTRTDAPIDASHADAWEQHLTGRALTDVAKKTALMASFLGYDSSRAAGMTPLSTARPFVTGTEVRARQAGSSINWKKTPRRPVADTPLKPPSPPRKRKRRKSVSLDDVTIRDVLRHRLVGIAQRRLSDDQRKRINDVRRKKPGVDRIIGPR
jgi:hypothetical protein